VTLDIFDFSEETSSTLPFSVNLATCFCRYSESSWGSSLLFLIYWKFLLWMGDVFCQMLFLHLLAWSIMIFITKPDNLYYISWLSNVDSVFHTWDKLHLLMVCNSFHRCWTWFANVLLSVLLMFMRGLLSVHWCSWEVSSSCLCLWMWTSHMLLSFLFLLRGSGWLQWVGVGHFFSQVS
jgi:hypothetical protein